MESFAVLQPADRIFGPSPQLFHQPVEEQGDLRLHAPAVRYGRFRRLAEGSVNGAREYEAAKESAAPGRRDHVSIVLRRQAIGGTDRRPETA